MGDLDHEGGAGIHEHVARVEWEDGTQGPHRARGLLRDLVQQLRPGGRMGRASGRFRVQMTSGMTSQSPRGAQPRRAGGVSAW